MQTNKYSLKQISHYIQWEISDYKILDIALDPVYEELNIVLSKYHYDIEELKKILKEIQEERSYCFSHFYELKEPKLSLNELAQQRKCSIASIMKEIKQIYSFLEKKTNPKKLRKKFL